MVRKGECQPCPSERPTEEEDATDPSGRCGDGRMPRCRRAMQGAAQASTCPAASARAAVATDGTAAAPTRVNC